MIVGPRSMKLPHSWDTGSDQPSAPAICHAWQPAISQEPENPFIFIWHFMDMQRAKPRTLLRLCIWTFWISFPRLSRIFLLGYFMLFHHDSGRDPIFRYVFTFGILVNQFLRFLIVINLIGITSYKLHTASRSCTLGLSSCPIAR